MENNVETALINGNFQKMYDDALLDCLRENRTIDDFIQAVVAIIINYIKDCHDRQQKVVDFKDPHQLATLINFNISQQPESLSQIIEYCQRTLRYCVKTAHPRFFNQLYGGIDIVGLCGQWLSSAANTSMYTYEVAPVFVMMENAVLNHMKQLIGFDNGDGIFTPGGSLANMFGISLARNKQFPQCKMEGLFFSQRMVILTSNHSHYSVKKGASFMGIGLNNVIMVDCDESGRMLPLDLEKKIIELLSKGVKPFMVNATCGTTVYGAFDPVDAIADVCEKYDLWLHVDAAWGGAVLFSPEKRYLMKGVHRANSVSWNPHKFMGCPFQCSAFLTKSKGVLEESHGIPASYLFQKDKMTYDVSYDTGNKSIQCGRNVDIMKLWLMWKAKGDEGFAKKVGHAYMLVNYLTEKIEAREGFELVVKPVYTNVCFWYIPTAIRDIADKDVKQAKLNQVAPKIKAVMTERGSMLVGYQPVENKVNFFRLILLSATVTREDMDFFLDEIQNIGEHL